MSFLTDKLVLLNSPGDIKSQLYYSRANSTVDLTEITYNDGRYLTDLTNKSFGGAGSINIPNASFIGNVYLQVELPPLISNQTVGRGWLFSLINRVTYVFGSANVSNLSISGQSLFQIAMETSETTEKKSQVLKLGGQEHLVNPTEQIIGQILIPMPFSSLCSLNKKLEYDSSLLGNPVQINFEFNDSTTIYGGSAILPTEMLRAQVTVRQGELSNKNDSIRTILRSNPESMYQYPIVHHQSFQVDFTSGALIGTKSLASTLIQQFINADLLGMSFGVVKNSSLRRDPITFDSPNRLNYERVRDVEILLNGLILYRGRDDLHQLFQLSQGIGSTFWEGSIIGAGAIGPFSSSPVNNNQVIVDFARIRSECYNGTFQNVFRVAQQTMTLNLSMESQDTFTAFFTFYYNGLISTDSSGTALIYFS